MGLSENPTNVRIHGFDFCNSTWRSIAVQRSGEVIIARGEKLVTQAPLIVNGASGGMPLSSGLTTSGMMVDRVIIKVPEYSCWGTYSGLNTAELYRLSGLMLGVWLGGYSGNAPYPSGGNICSGKGLWMPAGTQKPVYVDRLDDIYLAGEPSGYPVTFVTEVIPCPTD